jgi:hypothetical protein
MESALKAGIRPLEFWDMTPRETYMAIDAARWRAEQEARRDVALAWHIAALTRARRMPQLKQLLGTRPARPLKGRELETRRREHQEILARIHPDQLRKGKPGILQR